jgi:hypothetical protein
MPENFSGTKQNITVSATTTKENYFVYSVGVGGFYSPDDDPANNPAAFITSNNTLHLTYAVTGCAVANFSFTNNSFTIQPVSVGSCTVQFNATTPAGLSAESNLVTINVSQVPQGAQQTTVSSGGGGGGSMTQTTLVPLKENVESPKPLSILAPKLITIYENQTVDVPIEVRNNWTTSLKSIVLTAKTNATDVRMSFDNNFIEELPVNATRKVTMTVYGYRLGENFEVELGANVTSPVFHDTALVLFNSIEQSQEGKDVSLKVTFAQDLLSQHDECKELNELLQQADAQMRANHPDEANRLAETVINGCQYLISKTQQDTQRPGIIRTPFFELSDAALTIISYVLLGIAIIGAAAGLLYYHYKTKEEYNF